MRHDQPEEECEALVERIWPDALDESCSATTNVAVGEEKRLQTVRVILSSVRELHSKTA